MEFGFLLGLFSEGEFMVSDTVSEPLRSWLIMQFSTAPPSIVEGTYEICYHNNHYFLV